MLENTKHSITEGAEVVVKTCLALKPGENLVVVADYSNKESGMALAENGTDMGAEVTLMMIKERTFHAEDPPQPVIAAMCGADAAVLATVFSLSNSNARREANKHGTRVITLPGCKKEVLTSGAIFEDFEEMEPVVLELGRLLSESKAIHVKSEAGTDLRLKLCGRKSVDQTGMARKPGTWAPCPIIEAAVGPDKDGTDGVIMVDGTVIPGGIPEEPIQVEVKKGKVCSIEGGRDARKLEEFIKSFKDRNLYQVVEFGIGLNRKARIGRGLMAEDEGQFGTMHLGLGEGRTFGLPVKAPSHIDLVIRRPKVYVDGEVILENEQLAL